jgi:hypothetical protein
MVTGRQRVAYSAQCPHLAKPRFVPEPCSLHLRSELVRRVFAVLSLPKICVMLHPEPGEALRLHLPYDPRPKTRPGNKPTVSNALTPKIQFAYNGTTEVEDITYPGPQRVLFPFQMSFNDPTIFQDASLFPGGAQKASVTITASFNPSGGGTLTAPSAITLLKTPNPFILHNDPTSADPTVQQAWYLSMDLRVFQIAASGKRFGATVAHTGNAVADATGFITAVINNLNGDRAVADGLFQAIAENEDTAALSLAPTDGSNPIYSFALARVRTQDVAPANDVRVFFRMWAAQQTNALYDPNTTYASRTNPAGEKIPILGVQNDQIVTIPFFASPRVDTRLDGECETPLTKRRRR